MIFACIPHCLGRRLVSKVIRCGTVCLTICEVAQERLVDAEAIVETVYRPRMRLIQLGGGTTKNVENSRPTNGRIRRPLKQ